MEYENYFRSHFGSTFSQRDVVNYQKWFIAQWRLIQSKVPVANGARVLEVGSGIGGFFKVLSDSAAVEYLGIERDPEACSFANDFFSNSVFKNISLQDVLEGEIYDFVFAFEVLEHMENPLEAVEKIHALLRPGGIFCGTTPFPFRKNVMADNTHVSVLHPANWSRIFEIAKFEDTKIRAMSFVPFVWRIHPRLNLIFPFYVPFSGVISTSLIIARKSATATNLIT